MVDTESYRDRRVRDLYNLNQEYQLAIKPLIDMKVETMNLSTPKITVYKDGHVERIYSEQVNEMLAELDKHIKATWQKFSYTAEKLQAEIMGLGGR